MLVLKTAKNDKYQLFIPPCQVPIEVCLSRVHLPWVQNAREGAWMLVQPESKPRQSETCGAWRALLEPEPNSFSKKTEDSHVRPVSGVGSKARGYRRALALRLYSDTTATTHYHYTLPVHHKYDGDYQRHDLGWCVVGRCGRTARTFSARGV